MKSPIQQLGHYELILTVILTAFFWTGASSVTAQTTIRNQASASGDNLPPNTVVDSNGTELITGSVELVLIKTADRAAAEPGDTVIYRLALRNAGTAPASNIELTDKLPLGMQFLPESLQGSVTGGNNTRSVRLGSDIKSNRTIAFSVPNTLTLQPRETLNVVYGVLVTPDAIRGNGRNVAVEPRSNIASYLVRIRPGILSDCGTLIGRVFVDKNFDGEQQPGESGVPNAVVYMDDGNRITTDANGLFSVANVLSGNRTGTLDLTSLPGYTLAPNLYFIEGNSQSRLVRLEPGGLARMNFAVTPAYGEEQP
ncbi:MAG TPA: hypothetical protein DEG47_01785 [Cyanobacteria bacterium UBA11148]|nr:hypothetical protein [Cyanobacteria bacterium UBA11148]